MKGVPGLLLAVGLGIAGAFASWFYLAQKSSELAMIDFVAVARDKEINTGHVFTKGDFQRVPIPRQNAAALEMSAYKWQDVETIYTFRATKSYAPGELILRQHLTTPPQTDILSQLGDKEDLLWVPIDTRTSVPSLLNPGNMVSFIVPRVGRGAPTPANPLAAGTGSQLTELIGPFRILSLGNRMGSTLTTKGQGAPPTQENVMAIAVKRSGNQFDEMGQKLVDGLKMSNFQQVQVILHKTVEGKKK